MRTYQTEVIEDILTDFEDKEPKWTWHDTLLLCCFILFFGWFFLLLITVFRFLINDCAIKSIKNITKNNNDNTDNNDNIYCDSCSNRFGFISSDKT